MSRDGLVGTTRFWPLVDEYDDAVDRWFDQWRGNPAVDRIFYSASELGDHSLIWHLIASARAVVTARAEPAALRLVVALAIESGLVNGVVKSVFGRSRPITESPRPLRLRIPRTSSFPSGHASSATMAAVLLSERSKLGPLYAVLAATIATSRVHVRIHHASDVVGGALVGAALGIAVRRLRPLGD